MIIGRKFLKPVLTVTVLSATAFYGVSAVGWARPSDSSQELTADVMEVAESFACTDARNALAEAEEAARSANDDQG